MKLYYNMCVALLRIPEAELGRPASGLYEAKAELAVIYLNVVFGIFSFSSEFFGNKG